MADPAARRAAPPEETWTISLPDYGAFLFTGTEKEAEAMRRHKARWEGEVARKRRATLAEMAANEPILQQGDCGWLGRSR